MLSTTPVSSSSTPNFQPIFEKSLQMYKKKTGDDLTAHPLAAEINACDSPQAILAVLEGKANELNQSQSSDERLTKWLDPTVNILNALSATLGEGVGSVFPPTKIIFSGIGIVLVAAKETVASHDVLVELFDRIGSFFERLKVYTEVQPTQAVTDVLAKTMAEVLSILAIATKGIKERRTKTFLKKLAGMNDIEDALQRLRKLEHGELLMVIAQVSRDTSGLKDVAKETKAMVEEIISKMDASNWEGVLLKLKGWLSPPDSSKNYNIGLRDLHKETTTWFLDGRIFQGWHSSGSFLWIHGKPGSGKSIICSAIIQRILSLCNGGRASVAYFYFDFRDDDKKHRHNLLPSLLIQLAAHSIPCCDIISRVYSAHGKGTQQPSDEALTNCLISMLSATTQHPTYIIVDALDECPNTSGVRSPRGRVLSLIKDLIDLHLPNLHICVTSRPEVDIRNRLEPLRPFIVSLHDQPGQKEDIAKYIRSEVDLIANEKRWRDDDKGLVIEKLSKKADGMFRWVFCQLETLRLCIRSRVRHFVNELPDSLDETYERVLKEVHKTNQAYVERLLQCLAMAIRPLRVEELAEILTSDSDAIEEEVTKFNVDTRSEDQEQELLSACPSLITIVDSDGSRVVQFSHFSVKEFLISDRLATSNEDISRYHIVHHDAHATLAQASLHVLLRLDNPIGWRRAKRLLLAEYAARHWFSHAQVENVSSRVFSLMKTLFDSDKPHFGTWVRIYDIDKSSYWTSPSNPPNPLYYSALFGFYDLVEHLVKKHPQHVNAVGGEQYYPLAAALHGEHIRVAELLLQYGAKVDIQRSNSPMHRVVDWPDNLAVGAVQFLLKHGADVNPRRMDHVTPLHVACGNLQLESVRLLIEHGASVNAKNKSGRTPLHKALWGHDYNKDTSGVVRLLIEKGADVDAQGEDHDTPLHAACVYLQLKSVRLLVEHGASVNAKDKSGRTPLLKALWGQRNNKEDAFGVARLLVEKGADVEAQDEDHVTSLHVACSTLQLQSVGLLVEHGASVNAKNKSGRTPLHEALPENGDNKEDTFGVIQLLAWKGADVDAQDENHDTPLHAACGDFHLESVRLLIEHGASVNAKNKSGRTPLHEALWGHDDNKEDTFGVIQLLVGKGADVDAQDEDHDTPLHAACGNLQLEPVRLLIEHGASVNAKNTLGWTPLHKALRGGHGDNKEDIFGIVRLLVGKGADVDAQDENHGTPLHAACVYLQLESVRLLVEHGASINAKNKSGWTPLHQALRGYADNKEDTLGVVRLLVGKGAEVDAQDENHDTPLHAACRGLQLESVRLLIEHGASVNAKDKSGWTPLHQALLEHGYSQEDTFGVVRLLIGKGADVDAQDEDHTTPLHLVCGNLHLGSVHLLVEHGASVNAKNKSGQTPLHQALLGLSYSQEDPFGVARLLVEKGTDVDAQDEDHDTPLHLACDNLHLRSVHLLIEHGASINAKDKSGRTPLHRALLKHGRNEEGTFGVVRLLVGNGADVDARDEDHTTPLHLACDNLHLGSVHLLVEHGASVNAKDMSGRTPLHQALLGLSYSQEDPFGVIQLLVGKSADINAQDEDHTTPLHLACDNHHLESVRLLIEYDANVNAKDKQGRTPIYQALLSDRDSEARSDVAKLLIERGADVDARDEDHDTPLHHLASSNSELELVRVLLDYAANVDAKNKLGRTPLHQILLSKRSSEDRFGVARLLVERGADVNARDAACETPLHLASHFLDLKLVQMLLDHGGNANAEDDRGRTPLYRVLEDEGRSDRDELERGADANSRDDDHETPYRASRLVSLELAWILLKHGADLNAENKEGKIPFQLVQEGMRGEMTLSPSEYSTRRAVRAQGVVLMSLLYGYQYQ